jgi:hypothetical protein
VMRGQKTGYAGKTYPVFDVYISLAQLLALVIYDRFMSRGEWFVQEYKSETFALSLPAALCPERVRSAVEVTVSHRS